MAPRVAEAARAETLPASFKRLKVHMHMAVVVDEHGGTAGVITVDDPLKEVMGDVDNDATTAAALQRQADGSFLMPGDLAIDAFAKATGLTLEHLGRVPRVGDQASVGAVTFTVEAAEGLVITRVRATPNTVSAGPTEASWASLRPF